jgi:ubiquinone/menaquinone biosynthesis C-methylase UbiE
MIQSLHELVTAMGVVRGQTIMDAGCGSGKLSLEFAQIVGNTGTVYAVDVDRGAVEMVSSAANRAGLHNIRSMWADLERPVVDIPIGSIDIICARSLLSSCEDTDAVMDNFTRLLSDSGKIVIIDWTKSIAGVIPATDKLISRESLDSTVRQYGFETSFEKSVGEYHTMFILTKTRATLTS